MTDQESYLEVLKNNNITEAEVQLQVHRDDVKVKVPYVYKAKSKIHGTGLFTKYAVKKGKVVAAARVGTSRTIAGRYTNHSANPNAESFLMNRTFVFIATRDIEADEEVTVNYQQVIDVNKKAGL